jgi:MoxR-like ATPase
MTTSNDEMTPAELHERLVDEVETVLVGNREIVDGITTALLTRGHVLLEGVPGVAKTTIARLYANATGLEYTRIQMTPDTLPADITGTHVYREETGEFELQRGPVFANVVVADEINRATPKTQSALLEAMQERNVTIEGETLSLPEPFVVVATQNPIEMEGTFALPEAQRDRFQLKLTVNIPDRTDEAAILDRFDDQPDLGPDSVEEVIDQADITAARHAVESVRVADPVREYILDIVAASRESAATDHGGSPRASLAFLNAAKARAAIDDREYVIPDDIKDLAEPVLAHRLVLSTEAELSDRSPRDVVEEVVNNVETPSTRQTREALDEYTAEGSS